ncbi:MAG: hypothetical protein ABSF15_01500 [Candidatus Sulfotelmatobacter sp.]
MRRWPWAEAVTRLADTHVPDAVYEKVRAVFSEKEVANPTPAAISAWNRPAITGRTTPGTYQAPGRELKGACRGGP